jgi:DNA primase
MKVAFQNSKTEPSRYGAMDYPLGDLQGLTPRRALEDAGLKSLTQEDEYEWKALCPFHDDRDPSFYINFEQGVYYCFGCQRRGTVMKLFCRLLGIDRLWAAMYEAALRPGFAVERPARQLVFLPEGLLNQYPRLAASEYLQSRGIVLRRTLKDFDVRYDDEANQLVIPLRHVTGKLVGFVRRNIDSNVKPKYLHGRVPKSLVLFNLDRIVRLKSPTVVITEGPLDVLRAHDAGFPLCVATLGQALSPEQAGLLKQYIEVVFLAFDNDDKGRLYTSISEIRLNDVELKGVRLTIPEEFKDLGECTNDAVKEMTKPVWHYITERRAHRAKSQKEGQARKT